MTIRTKRFYLILLAEVSAVLLLVAGYLFLDSERLYEWVLGEVEYSYAPENCNLKVAPCEARFPDGSKVVLSISPKEIPVMQPLQYRVESTDLQTDSLKLEIFGTNMNMGLYGATLSKHENGVYQGKGMLPTCTGKMFWRANLIKEGRASHQGIAFKFETD